MQNRYLPGIEEHFREQGGKVPYHVEDYLKNHFEVYNYAYGGVSNVDIAYQFSNLPEYQPGDRLAVIWTSPLRFSIKDKEGQNFTFGDFNIPFFDDPTSINYIPPILQDSITGKLKALLQGDNLLVHQEQKNFFNNELRFINHYKRVHSEYRPIFMAWDQLLFENIDIINVGYGSSIYPSSKVKFSDEGDFDDPHLGVVGNWCLYKFLHSQLEVQDPPLPISYSYLDPHL